MVYQPWALFLWYKVQQNYSLWFYLRYLLLGVKELTFTTEVSQSSITDSHLINQINKYKYKLHLLFPSNNLIHFNVNCYCCMFLQSEYISNCRRKTVFVCGNIMWHFQAKSWLSQFFCLLVWVLTSQEWIMQWQISRKETPSQQTKSSFINKSQHSFILFFLFTLYLQQFKWNFWTFFIIFVPQILLKCNGLTLRVYSSLNKPLLDQDKMVNVD